MKKKMTLAVLTAAVSLCSCTTVSGSGTPPLPPPNTSQAQSSEDTQSESVNTVTAASTETTAADITNSQALYRGNIYDVNGKLLAYTSTESGVPRRVYTSDYAVPFANIITEMSEGYDTAFNDKLMTANPTPVNGSSDYGQSISLTIDADVQKRLYDYMESVNLDGTLVVLRTDGSILAQVSYPSYDPNAVAEQKYDKELAWGKCGNKAFKNYQPGSCFKIMSEVIADKHGVYELYDDGKWEFDGTAIVNWDHDTNPYYPIQSRTLSSAFINSSNIFFAKAFDKIGAADVLADLNEMFHFGTDIECDFGPIQNNIEIYCNDDLRRTAFGQSYILTCPIYLAALGREAVFGDMVRPFVLKNTVDTASPSTVIGSGSKAGDVIASIPQNLRQNLLDGMRGVASNLNAYVPQGYTLYAKTGTAETWEGDFLYITGCVKNNNDNGSTNVDYASYKENGSYVIVMELQNPIAHGFSFASDSARIYNGAINVILG